MLRPFFLLAMALLTGSNFTLCAQSLNSVLQNAGFAKELGLMVDEENKIIPAFNREYTAVITFSYAESSVYYFVFEYNPTDSLAFWNGIAKYNMASNCSFEPHDTFERNFYTFDKSGYFFLRQLCPCRTVNDEECATLATLINQWALKRD